MKQEIHCPSCAEGMKKIVEGEENISFVAGEALSDYYCDFCGEEIPHGSSCVAFSAWNDRFPKRRGWEKKYVQAEKRKEVGKE